MRIDSCRKCGNALETTHTCLICEEGNKFRCVRCDVALDEQYHTQCVF